jgi:hypothetical protein
MKSIALDRPFLPTCGVRFVEISVMCLFKTKERFKIQG